MKTLILVIVIFIVAIGGYRFWQQRQATTSTSEESMVSETMIPSPTPLPSSISIMVPGNDEVLMLGKTATVSGSAVALFEGNVVIRLTDSAGKVVFEEPITVTDWMQATPVAWSTEIVVPATAAPGLAQLTAVNPSPKDASEDSSDTVSVKLTK